MNEYKLKEEITYFYNGVSGIDALINGIQECFEEQNELDNTYVGVIENLRSLQEKMEKEVNNLFDCANVLIEKEVEEIEKVEGKTIEDAETFFKTLGEVTLLSTEQDEEVINYEFELDTNCNYYGIYCVVSTNDKKIISIEIDEDY